MTPKIVTFEQAPTLIPDGASVAISGAWMLLPDSLLAAVGRRFLETGHPRDLTALFLLCPGGTPDQPGIEHLAHEGLLRRTIGGSYPNLPDSRLRKLIAEDKVEAYNVTGGMAAAWFREVGANRPGVFTRCGLHTFVDPRQEGGRMNAAARDEILQVVQVDGADCLYFPAFPVDVALIRATTADEAGNLTMEHEPATLTAFVQAAAARASGGKVIAQVKRVVPRGSLKPHEVKVPASLADFLVVEPEPLQAGGIRLDPTLCGLERGPLDGSVSASPSDLLIARRTLAEIRKGDTVVLGYGISALVPYLLVQQERFEDAFFTIEQGSFGGLPLTDFGFGSSRNPLAILDAASQFDLFQGGCFDLGMLSFLQVDDRGRVNVHRLDARPALSAGIGGFLDIAANAPRLLLVGYFTAGGLQVSVEDSKVRIDREGKMKKFVPRIDHVSFDPAYGRAREVLFITERAVFRLDHGRLALIELMPGIDLERDILAQMGFKPEITL